MLIIILDFTAVSPNSLGLGRECSPYVALPASTFLIVSISEVEIAG